MEIKLDRHEMLLRYARAAWDRKYRKEQIEIAFDHALKFQRAADMAGSLGVKMFFQEKADYALERAAFIEANF